MIAITCRQVMDLCTGGDFFDFLSYRGSVTEDEARALFLQAGPSPSDSIFIAPSRRGRILLFLPLG
jgi:hypothetical protein